MPRAKCLSRSPASGIRCTSEHGHAGDHEFHARGCLPVEQWPRLLHDYDAPPHPTIEQLVTLLRSYSAYALAAGYVELAGEVEAAIDRYTRGGAAATRAAAAEDPR